MEMSEKDKYQQKFNKRMWYLLGFITLIIYLYSLMYISDHPRNGECVEKGNCPDEWEMRGGDTW